MAAAIGVRADYTSGELRRFARRFGDADQVRRLLAVALILDGGSRSEAAKMAGVTLLIVRDWVLRLNAGGPDGLATRKAPGRASIRNDAQRARLAEIVETGPIPAANGVVRWRLCDLAQWIDSYNEERPHSAIGNIPPIRLANSAGATSPPDLGKAENSRPERSKVGWQCRKSETLPLNVNNQRSTSRPVSRHNKRRR